VCQGYDWVKKRRGEGVEGRSMEGRRKNENKLIDNI
jgi:hypothetical protein